MHQDVDLGREATHDVHVVLDHQNGNLGWQARDGIKQYADFVGRYPSRGLVEQQHLGFERQRKSDLQEPLFAIGNFSHSTVPAVGQMEALYAK